MNMLDKRAAGVLMHISSLPGEGGIGTMGRHAYNFVDFLVDSGQTYWQILPICPTGYGDSPYQSFSTFAGNPYFIDLELLQKEGWLSKKECDSVLWASDERCVDYGLLYVKRHELFLTMQSRFEAHPPAQFADFCQKNAFWLDDYALFMAIKDFHNGKAVSLWEAPLRLREKEALSRCAAACSKRVMYYKMLQYFFFSQWFALKSYANKKGIRIIGDIPIYVSADSADVWASPQFFLLDKDRHPVVVAGCPPDGFSAAGQLWGNPVYNWDELASTGYRWWLTRLEYSLRIYDVLRIDHFRGFESFYCIPAGAPSATGGVWKKGPALSLFEQFRKEVGAVSVIAEDLGFLTDAVRTMVRDSGFPGMKILQFAFDSREENDYLPEHYEKNCVVYTGTHDNDTILGWTKSSRPKDVQAALSYFGIHKTEELRPAMMRAALYSNANTCILTMQDILSLDGSARMNTPATLGKNWTWRATEAEIAALSRSDFAVATARSARSRNSEVT